MGEILSTINARVNAAGAMMGAAHHSVKDRGNPYGRPTLDDLSYAGLPQFARQWFMIKRECPYDGSGVHKLNLISGGSSNHTNDFELVIETGALRPDLSGMLWNPRINFRDVGQSNDRQDAVLKALAEDETKQAVKLAKEQKDAERLYEAMLREGIGLTATQWRKKPNPGMTVNQVERSLEILMGEKRAEEVEVRVKNGTGTRPEKGFRAIPPPGSQGHLDLNPDNSDKPGK